MRLLKTFCTLLLYGCDRVVIILNSNVLVQLTSKNDACKTTVMDIDDKMYCT